MIEDNSKIKFKLSPKDDIGLQSGQVSIKKMNNETESAQLKHKRDSLQKIGDKISIKID